jgi:hypothetical protein
MERNKYENTSLATFYNKLTFMHVSSLRISFIKSSIAKTRSTEFVISLNFLEDFVFDNFTFVSSFNRIS